MAADESPQAFWVRVEAKPGPVPALSRLKRWLKAGLWYGLVCRQACQDTRHHAPGPEGGPRRSPRPLQMLLALSQGPP
jgi:hypothetical protein